MCHKKTNNSKEEGITLLELVLALAIIGISSATISALVVIGFNFIQSNESYGQKLRAAESCYETLLAIEENDLWRPGSGNPSESVVYQSCGDGNGWVSITAGAITNSWTTPEAGNLLSADRDGTSEACGITLLPDGGNFECRTITVSEAPSIQFRIPISGSNNLELVITEGD